MKRYLVLVLIVFTLLLLVPLPALGGRDGDKPAPAHQNRRLPPGALRRMPVRHRRRLLPLRF